MRNSKGSLSLLLIKQEQLKKDIKEFTKRIDNAQSMQESIPFIELRMNARMRLAPLPGEIARVKQELKRLEENYSNEKLSTKPITKVYSKGKK